MAVRVNSIQSPSEEMAELQKLIEQEKAHQRSCKISANPDYYNNQAAYLDEQIKVLQDKRALLDYNYNQAENNIAESRERQKKYRQRYLQLKHRVKIAKAENICENFKVVAAELGISVEELMQKLQEMKK